MSQYHTRLASKPPWKCVMEKGGIANLQAHSLPKFSFPTLQFDPAEKAAGAIRGQILLFFEGSEKGWRGGHWLSLAAVKGFLVQMHTSSSVGGHRRSDNDLRVVPLQSHALCFSVHPQRCISPGAHLTVRERWEHPAFSGYGFTGCGKDPWAGTEATSLPHAQVSALTSASSPFLLQRKLCSYTGAT